MEVRPLIYDQNGRKAGSTVEMMEITDSIALLKQTVALRNPHLWSTTNPVLYTAVTILLHEREEMDRYRTVFGIRSFEFHPEKGFFLNGVYMKIKGVNLHHDMGALGAAVNKRAIERQLEILKKMGCNAIRSAHNVPAPELLCLCDRMGFLVIDESFDVWSKPKLRQDDHTFFDTWHTRDLEDMVRRDRNHPSVIAWSIGNEIREQFDSSGTRLAKELYYTVKALDVTRPITCALTEQDPEKNHIYLAGVLDLIGFNYKHREYLEFPTRYPGESLIATENVSALSTRGHYDMPSDSVRIWPARPRGSPEVNSPDYTISAYDNVHAYWGSTHEATLEVVMNNDFISGMFIWSGFDYLGEPTPFQWPARSSYFGIIDLAGFPKDTYYLYQSVWSETPVLHVFPHWNWEEGQTVDVWAYYNQADEAELFLNGESMGVCRKAPHSFHVMWRLDYRPGKIQVVTRNDRETVMVKEINTAGEPSKIILEPDRDRIRADGRDLSFITVKIVDGDGNLCPRADNKIYFRISGNGFIAGVDNGYQASHEPFRSDSRKALNGMCLLIVQSTDQSGDIHVEARSDGMEPSDMMIRTRN